MIEDKKKGIFCIIMAAISFATMNTLVKLSGDNIPFIVKTIFRTIIAAAIAFVIVLGENKNNKKHNIEKKPIDKKRAIIFLIIRSFFGTIGIICNFYAVVHLNVSDASMLNKLSPFYAIILSAIFLHEKPDKVQWIAVALAFCGSLFIIKPSFAMSAFPGFVGALGGLGAGVAYTAVRQLSKEGVRSSIIILFFSLFSVIVVLPFTIIYWVPVNSKELMLLAGSGVAAAAGQFFITNAYKYAPAKEISVYDYSQIMFAAILGFIFLGQMPDLYSVIGYVVICSVGVWVFLHNRKTA